MKSARENSSIKTWASHQHVPPTHWKKRRISNSELMWDKTQWRSHLRFPDGPYLASSSQSSESIYRILGLISHEQRLKWNRTMK